MEAVKEKKSVRLTFGEAIELGAIIKESHKIKNYIQIAQEWNLAHPERGTSPAAVSGLAISMGIRKHAEHQKGNNGSGDLAARVKSLEEQMQSLRKALGE